MDQLLVPYLRASNESEAQQLLDEILVVHAGPAIRFILLQKLGFRLNSFGLNPNNQDAEDLYYEIVAKIVELLRALRESPKNQVENFHQYVKRTATNACHDYVRARSPARTRLKYGLREVLRRRAEFFLRKSDGATLCGLSAWAKDRAPISSQRFAQVEDELQIFRITRFGHEDMRRVPLTRVIAELLVWVDAPIELETLVNITAILLGVKDHPTESLDDEARGYLEGRLSDTKLMSTSDLDFEKLLRDLWQAVTRLPDKQRDTFCFSFDLHGEDLFTLLLEAEVVSLPQLAQHLGRSLEDLMRLWSEMPMDYAGTAVELEATVSQVRRWRFDALRRLERGLRPFLRQK